jgi:hypothetical protein
VSKSAVLGTELRLRLLGVGAMDSPRYAPAGLLVVHPNGNMMLDGAQASKPEPPLRAWLVTDLRAELIAEIRRLAGVNGLEPGGQPYQADGLVITPHPVVHTSHPTWAYLQGSRALRVVGGLQNPGQGDVAAVDALRRGKPCRAPRPLRHRHLGSMPFSAVEALLWRRQAARETA